MSVQFNSMSLYPAGYFTRQIPVGADRHLSGRLDRGVRARRRTRKGATYSYAPTNYEVLVDSPAVAGRYYKEWALSPRVDLNMWADSQADLDAAKPEYIDAHYRRTVEQAVRLFGAQHYDHYEFLHTMSDTLGGIGLEHHRSTEIGSKPGYFRDWATMPPARNVVPHEFTHSWDGKFRRGADLWTPNFNVPMRGSLLWVYEGQTQFWGYVLQARGGHRSASRIRSTGSRSIAATYDNNRAREWRDLVDTTNDPIISRAQAQGLDQLAAQRGLLQRRDAGLARSRFADPREDRRGTSRSTISPAPSSACATATGGS